jgi:hypothetical protein
MYGTFPYLFKTESKSNRTFSVRVRFGSIEFLKSRFGFGSIELSKSRFGFGSVRLIFQNVGSVRFRSLVQKYHCYLTQVLYG